VDLDIKHACQLLAERVSWRYLSKFSKTNAFQSTGKVRRTTRVAVFTWNSRESVQARHLSFLPKTALLCQIWYV